MPLPSQSARPQSRTTHMYRRRRPRRTVLTVLMLILLGMTVSVWAWMRSDQPQQSSAETAIATATATEAVAGQPSGSERSDRQPIGSFSGQVEDQPRSITMGQRVPLDSSSRLTPDRQQVEESAPPPRSVLTSEPARKETRPEPKPQTRPDPRQGARDEPMQQEGPETRTPPPPSTPVNQRVVDRLRSGMDLLATNQPIEARRVLTQALLTPGIDRRTAHDIRETLTELNERLIFGREVIPGDPFAFGYTIRPGDTLARIALRENTHVDWRFIQRINGIARPETIQAGRQIKLVQGPFHAVVVKQDYRFDVFLGEGSDRVYVRSFPVGLGEHDSTPVGRFRVRPDSKLINPAWTNPRTGQHFTANDPENPIGNRWIGLEGITETIRGLGGYGIHGTIDPESIGRQESMGCIRLHKDNVELLYEMLIERESTVEIVDR